MLAVSNDTMANLTRFRRHYGIEFPLLLDPDLEAVVAFGILNEVVAHPAVMILDRGGVVRHVQLDVDFRRRPSAAHLLTVLDALRRGDGAVASAHGQKGD